MHIRVQVWGKLHPRQPIKPQRRPGEGRGTGRGLRPALGGRPAAGGARTRCGGEAGTARRPRWLRSPLAFHKLAKAHISQKFHSPDLLTPRKCGRWKIFLEVRVRIRAIGLGAGLGSGSRIKLG